MIAVLEAEVAALRDGRTEDADLLRKAREAAAQPVPGPAETPRTCGRCRIPADTTSRGDLPEPGRRRSARAVPSRGAGRAADDGPRQTVEGGEEPAEPSGPRADHRPSVPVADPGQPGAGEVTASVVVAAPAAAGLRRVHRLGTAGRVDPVHQGPARLRRRRRGQHDRGGHDGRARRAARRDAGGPGRPAVRGAGGPLRHGCCAGPGSCAARRWPATGRRWSGTSGSSCPAGWPVGSPGRCMWPGSKLSLNLALRRFARLVETGVAALAGATVGRLSVRAS